jgi:hypothetical protein
MKRDKRCKALSIRCSLKQSTCRAGDKCGCHYQISTSWSSTSGPTVEGGFAVEPRVDLLRMEGRVAKNI